MNDKDRLATLVQSLPDIPQRQDSLSDQLRDLQAVATRLGMYDAADWLAARRLPAL